MGLSLSTTAAPELTLEALGAASVSRGLEGLELGVGTDDNHDVLSRRVRAAGARVVALRVETIDARDAPKLAAASARLGVPVSVPLEGVVPSELSALARAFLREEGLLLIAVRTDLEAVLTLREGIGDARAGASRGMAWDVRPSSESLVDGGAILLAARDLLGLVRLHGGGPEQRAQEGRGVGALLTDLALSRTSRPIVLCPSGPEAVPLWQQWLGSKKISGCGGKTEASVVMLDVCDVEPRDRLDTILGAYRSLARGGTMRLTVDHDPSCMYYTLQATQAEGSFAFRTVEQGPEVWRAEVTKL